MNEGLMFDGISMGIYIYMYTHTHPPVSSNVATSPRVKSHQLVKVVSGGRAKKLNFGITTNFSN